VFNETVNVIELEEGLEFETFFLYVFLAAGVVLLLVAGQQLLTSVGKKRVTKRPVVETGTNNPDDVDYDWLPDHMKSTLSKSFYYLGVRKHNRGNHSAKDLWPQRRNGKKVISNN